jgi:hypothetical protein|tara:strand:- start:2886 stop:3530 length:645 start_codon:yes stop_codon:yes gene_type:complete
MSNLLDKFKTLCTKNIKLPDSGEITATQLNVQFQNKLYDIIRNIQSEFAITIYYIQYLNNYILDVSKLNTITYRDKLYLIQHWKNELDDEKIEIEFNDSFSNDQLVTKLQDVDLTFKFKLPIITDENTLLQYITNRKVVESDVMFFDIFRFIETITLDTEEYTIKEMELDEVYELFLLFDIKILDSLTKQINSNLGDINKLRVFEADFSFFIDL